MNYEHKKKKKKIKKFFLNFVSIYSDSGQQILVKKKK